ncbi:MAG: hypothetical protein ACRDU5_18985 [Mycobacterium sp.]
MTVPRPHDRPISIHATPDDALETFTVRLPRWPIFGLLSRNPLVRRSDRIEALVLALAVVVLLLAVPVAAAVGTVVHDSRRDVYAEQAQTRHVVTATSVAAAAAILVAGTRAVCDRIRAIGWRHDIDTLVGRDGQRGQP